MFWCKQKHILNYDFNYHLNGTIKALWIAFFFQWKIKTTKMPFLSRTALTQRWMALAKTLVYCSNMLTNKNCDTQSPIFYVWQHCFVCPKNFHLQINFRFYILIYPKYSDLSKQYRCRLDAAEYSCLTHQHIIKWTCWNVRTSMVRRKVSKYLE